MIGSYILPEPVVIRAVVEVFDECFHTPPIRAVVVRPGLGTQRLISL